MGRKERRSTSELIKSNMLSIEGKTPRKKFQFLSKPLFSKLIIVIIMENKNLQWLLCKIETDCHFDSALTHLERDFLVKIYKISELTPPVVMELYNTMQKKFYLNRKISNEEYWYQNQLRIFVWLLFAYLHASRKNIASLNQDDWKFFSSIFNFKSTVFFEFQAKSLIKPHGKPAPWGAEQTQLLETIIKQKNQKNRWNSTARELFVRSNKQYFRNPKQCRERWMNHLDPSKIHTQWGITQDLILLNCIKKKGKRWSIAVKELSNTRTEHMVKNRYKSLISNQAKKYPGKRQGDIQTILIKKLNKAQEKAVKQSLKIEHVQPDNEGLVKVQKQEHIEVIGSEIQAEKHQKPNEIKELIKIQAEFQGCSQIDKLANHQLSEFQANSPIFIPWNLQGLDQCFNNGGRLKMQDHFFPNDSSQIQDSQQF